MAPASKACEVCGNVNPSHLTFCAHCGNRLQKKPKELAPTPVEGVEAPKRNRAVLDDPGPDASEAVKNSRPSAPALFLSKRGAEASEARPHAASKEAAAPTGDPPRGKIACPSCGALSPKGYRFCLSCGGVLKAKKAPEPKGSDRRTETPPRRDAKVEKAEAPAADRFVTCSRCSGRCAAGEAFCKYCGAPLAKGSKRAGAGRIGSDSQAAAVRAGRDAVRREAARQEASRGDGKGEPRRRISVNRMPSAPPPPPRAAKAQRSARPPASIPPSPAERPTGRLVVIVEDGSEGASLNLVGQQVDIGSREGDIVLSDDRYLSPRHARFFRQDDAWYLRDLDSVNGVFRRIREQTRLRHGDRVLLGLEVLQFELVEHGERGLGHAIEHGTLVFGSPAAVRRARLCQRTVEGVVRDVYHLVADETTVGRESGDIVFSSDPFMSRRHAALRWRDNSQDYVLADLNSSNGTYLAIREDLRLEDGDFIRLGQHLFRVDLSPRRPSGGLRAR